ncbi:hypothetical protein ACFQL4_13295 [Halosimplex aquaticum]
MPAGDPSGSDSTDSDGAAIGRRPLLGALAAVGLAGCPGQSGDGETDSPGDDSEVTEPATDGVGGTTPRTAADGWPDVADPYYGRLAADLEEMGLPAGEFVYAESESATLDAFSVNSSVGETSSVSVGDGDPFSSAVRVTVAEETENPWDVTMKGTVTDRSVAAGDVLLAVVSSAVPNRASRPRRCSSSRRARTTSRRTWSGRRRRSSRPRSGRATTSPSSSTTTPRLGPGGSNCSSDTARRRSTWAGSP